MSEPLIAPWLFSLALMLGLLICVKFGFTLGQRHGVKGDVNALSGSVFGLLGLLLAFSFSGAANRFDYVRDLVTQEAMRPIPPICGLTCCPPQLRRRCASPCGITCSTVWLPTSWWRGRPKRKRPGTKVQSISSRSGAWPQRQQPGIPIR